MIKTAQLPIRTSLDKLSNKKLNWISAIIARKRENKKLEIIWQRQIIRKGIPIILVTSHSIMMFLA